MMKSSSVSREVLGLFGDVDQTPVERALAELRSGRAVLLDHNDRSLAVAAVEFVTDDVLRGLGQITEEGVRLVLTPARLHALGEAWAERPMAIDATALSPGRISALARDRDQSLKETLLPTDVAVDSAILLARLALLIPAVLVAPVSAASAQALQAITVTSEAVRRFDAERSNKVTLVSRAPVPLLTARKAEFVVFRGGEGMRDQVAIVVGAPDPQSVVPVRLHSACLTGDLFGSLRCDCGDQLRGTVAEMARGEGGILLYLDQEGRGNGIASKIRAYGLQSEGMDTYEADETLGYGLDARRFGFAAEMLRQLGYTRIRLLTNNPEKIVALEEAGIDVVATQRVYGRKSSENARYLSAKRERAGHMLDTEALENIIASAAE